MPPRVRWRAAESRIDPPVPLKWSVVDIVPSILDVVNVVIAYVDIDIANTDVVSRFNPIANIVSTFDIRSVDHIVSGTRSVDIRTRLREVRTIVG